MAELSPSSSSHSFGLSTHPPADTQSRRSDHNQSAEFDVDGDDDAEQGNKGNTETMAAHGNPNSTITNEDNGINNTTSLVSVTKSFSGQVSDRLTDVFFSSARTLARLCKLICLFHSRIDCSRI